MALLKIPYGETFALIKPCARGDIEVLEYLLKELRSEWLLSKPPLNGYNTLSKECLDLIEKIVDLLPRADSIEPIPVDQIPENSLLTIFIAKTDYTTAEFSACELVTFHHFEPLPPSKKIPPLSEEITVDNVPIKSSGNLEADLLGSLLCLTQGDAIAAAYIIENWDSEFIDKVLYAYNERSRDPEERKAAYMNEEFEKWKTANADVVRKARFGW